MFYEPSRGHGLPHDPIKAIIAPRPIGWISTLDAEGRPNLAPYSFFNMVQTRTPLCMFGSDGLKHTAANAIATGEFVFNLVSRPLFDAMNATSASLGQGVDEFEAAGLAKGDCHKVGVPRVAASPAALECKVVHSMELHMVDGTSTGGWLIVGQVVGVHINEDYLTDGLFDTVKAQAVARCGYRDYSQVTEMFAALRPTDNGAYRPGGGDH